MSLLWSVLEMIHFISYSAGGIRGCSLLGSRHQGSTRFIAFFLLFPILWFLVQLWWSFLLLGFEWCFQAMTPRFFCWGSFEAVVLYQKACFSLFHSQRNISTTELYLSVINSNSPPWTYVSTHPAHEPSYNPLMK